MEDVLEAFASVVVGFDFKFAIVNAFVIGIMDEEDTHTNANLYTLPHLR